VNLEPIVLPNGKGGLPCYPVFAISKNDFCRVCGQHKELVLSVDTSGGEYAKYEVCLACLTTAFQTASGAP
jgi:hypothetical protein